MGKFKTAAELNRDDKEKKAIEAKMNKMINWFRSFERASLPQTYQARIIARLEIETARLKNIWFPPPKVPFSAEGFVCLHRPCQAPDVPLGPDHGHLKCSSCGGTVCVKAVE